MEWIIINTWFGFGEKLAVEYSLFLNGLLFIYTLNLIFTTVRHLNVQLELSMLYCDN